MLETKLTVELNKSQFDNIMFSLEKMLGQIELEQNDLPYRCSVDYQQAVIGAIMRQTYAPGYASYNARYLAWKREYSSGGFHNLSGDLVNNIKAFKVGTNAWMGGVTPGVLDSGRKSWYAPMRSSKNRGKRKVIAMYATTMELGLGKQPKRPLFAPVRDTYAEGKWRERGIESLKKVVRNW